MSMDLVDRSEGLKLHPSAPPVASLLLKMRARDEVSEAEALILSEMVGNTTVLETHQDIITEGDRPEVCTLLVDGFAARYKLLENGTRQITAVHTPGDFVDLHSFLLHHMDHGVSSLTTCRIAKVPHQKLKEVSERHPHLLRMFWLMTLIDGATHREWLVAMGRRTAVAHVAHLICELYCQLNLVGLAPDLEFLFPVTQSDLADMVGLSSVHVNRVLQELRGSELITWRGAHVKILDWTGLREKAEFEEGYLHLVKEPR